jgi:2-methylisocitrate lyase-like PEP mutase family enzyme
MAIQEEVDQGELAARFLRLHRPGTPLLMPNAWDVGSAVLVASLGFAALATTSGGSPRAGVDSTELTKRGSRAVRDAFSP